MFTIINETKGRLPSLPFAKMKKEILGDKYELDLVFVDEEKIHSLNRTYRKVDSPTDILSFPIDKRHGQIFICEKMAEKKAKEFSTFGKSLPAKSGRRGTVGREKKMDNFISFLFIHGNVHLLGYDHGDEMEKVEMKFGKIFKI